MRACNVREKGGKVVAGNRHHEVAVDLIRGTWTLTDRATGTVAIQDGAFRLGRPLRSAWHPAETDITWSQAPCRNVFGPGVAVTVTFTPREGYEPVRMIVFRLYESQRFIELGWGVRNPFARPVRVREAFLLHGGALFPGRTIKRPQCLKSGAGAEPNPVERGWQVEAQNGVLLTGLCDGSRRSIVAGGLVYGDYARCVEVRDGAMSLAAWDPQGKTIAPGAEHWSPDTAYLDVATADPFEACEAYGMALRAANGAKPKTYDFPTLCGWMVSTTSLGEGKPINNSPGLVEQTRLARERGFMKYSPFAVRLEPDAYCHGNFGDTQQGWWDDEHWAAIGPGSGAARGEGQGSLRKPFETFAKFCRAVADLGGIPFTYFQSSMPSNDFALAHPDWMLRNDISELHLSHPHHRPFVRYDYTDPGFRAHCRKVWRRLRKAGIRGIKFDYPETAWASGGGFEDADFTTTAAYREMFRLCREGLGEEAFLHERNLGGKTHEDAPRLDVNAGIVDLQRVWGDASHFEPEMASRMGLRWYKSRSVFVYYPDGKSFYQNGRPLPAYKRRAFLTLIAFLSGRIEIGTSVGSMTDEMFHDLTRLFPMFGGIRSPRPVDMLLEKEHPEAYVYAVEDGWWQVLLVNNRKAGRRTVSVPLSGDMAETGALGLEAGERYHAFDFWNQQYLGVLQGTEKLSVALRGGEVAMVSLRRVREQPQIVSTNRHILQGMMEVHGVRWDARRRMLSGAVDVVGGEEFVLTLACNGHAPGRCEGAEVRPRADSATLVDLVFRAASNARVPFRLHCSGAFVGYA